MNLGLNWGATASERAEAMPCDALVSGDCTRADRAISVGAPPAIVFAWLCQLRVAPYSYDLLDNFGRRSPRVRDAALCHLEVGQRFMSLFRLDSFADAEQITLRTRSAAVTYAVKPCREGTRLHARVLFSPGVLGRATAAGDAVMMRKQLLTLKALAEHEAAAPRARRREVAVEDARLVDGRYDYADAFEIELRKGDSRSPEQAFRATPLGRGFGLVPYIFRYILRFQLGPLTSPEHVLGWRVVSSDTEVLHLATAGPLMRATIVARRADPSIAAFTTFVVYVRAPARTVWSVVGPLHRAIAPRLLESWVTQPAAREPVR